MALDQPISSVLGSAGEAKRTVRYMCEYELSKGLPHPAANTLRSIEGIDLWHLRTPEDDATEVLVVYWASYDWFLCEGRRLETCLQTRARDEGFVGAVGVRERPWFARIKPTTVILSVAALLGALEVITTKYAVVFAAPSLFVRQDIPSYAMVEGAEHSVQLEIVNQLTTEHSNISLSAELLSGGQSVLPVRLSDSTIAHLPASETKQVRGTFVAPKPGVYTMQVTARGAAGWIRPEGTFVGTAEVEVWPRVPTATVRVVDSGKRFARLQVDIRLGHPAIMGLDCQLTISGLQGQRFENIDAPVAISEAMFTAAGEGDTAISLLDWSLAPLKEGMRAVPVYIALSSPAQMNWNMLNSRSTVECVYRKEDFPNAKR